MRKARATLLRGRRPAHAATSRSFAAEALFEPELNRTAVELTSGEVLSQKSIAARPVR